MNTPLLALTSRNWLVVAVLTTALGNGVAQAGTQLRYEGSGVGCGVLDRTGAFLESYACMTTLTFNATDTTTAAGVYVVHYQATTQLGPLLGSRHVQFSGATTGTPCFVNVLGLYNYPLPPNLPPSFLRWSTLDWQENILPDGTVRLDCFVHDAP